MADVAVKAGVRFTVLDETLLAGIPLEPAGVAVDVDGRRMPLMRGRSYADSARIDALMDEYGDMPLRGHVADEGGRAVRGAARPWRPAAAPGTPAAAGRTVSFPPVLSFGRLERDKWLAVKTLEEAAELTEASKRWLKSGAAADRRDMLAEYADTLQTLANLAAAMGLTDAEIAAAMDDCRERNRERGRL